MAVRDNVRAMHAFELKPDAPPATAHPVRYRPRASLDEIARAALTSSLDQVLRNVCALESGHGGDEHVHQLRVGIRRVRTVLRELMPDARESIEPPLLAAFRALGVRRDIEHVVMQVEPALRDAGSPSLRAVTAHDAIPSPAEVVQDDAFQEALLRLTALAQPGLPSAREPHARRQLAHLLGKLSRKVLAEGLKFERLDRERQHRVRKRAKRLRYLGEFAASAFDRQAFQAWETSLEDVQDALGTWNDEQVALAYYRTRAAQDPPAWFAVGWLSARRAKLAKNCAHALKRFAQVKSFCE